MVQYSTKLCKIIQTCRNISPLRSCSTSRNSFCIQYLKHINLKKIYGTLQLSLIFRHNFAFFYRKMEDNLGEKEDDQESGRNQEDKEEEAVWMLDPSDTQNFFSHEPQ